MNFGNKPLYNTVCGLNLIGCMGSSMGMYFRYMSFKRTNRKYRENYNLVVSELNSKFLNKQLFNELQLRQNLINYNKVVVQLNINDKYNKCINEIKFNFNISKYDIVIREIKVVFRKNKLLNELDGLFLKQKYFRRLKEDTSKDNFKNFNIIENNNKAKDNNYIII